MTERNHYEILVIGSGESGKSLAWAMAKAGRSTAVVERKLIGGSCPNIACLPSKNVIHSANTVELVRRGGELGLTLGDPPVEMTGVRARKRRMVDGLIQMHLDKYRDSGAELIMANARFTGDRTVEATAEDGTIRTLSGDQVFLNLGTRAALPDIPGLHEAHPITHVEALELDHVPEHLIVLGGGFVGLELAQAMRRFGSRVTVLERGPELARGEDADASEEILRIFRQEGIDVLLKTHLAGVGGVSGKGVQVRLVDL